MTSWFGDLKEDLHYAYDFGKEQGKKKLEEAD